MPENENSSSAIQTAAAEWGFDTENTFFLLSWPVRKTAPAATYEEAPRAGPAGLTKCRTEVLISHCRMLKNSEKNAEIKQPPQEYRPAINCFQLLSGVCIDEQPLVTPSSSAFARRGSPTDTSKRSRSREPATREV